MTGTIGIAIRKAKTEFDPGVSLAKSLAKLFVGAGLTDAVVFSVVDGSEVGFGTDAWVASAAESCAVQMSAKLIPAPEAELASAVGSAAPVNEMTESIAAVTVLS